MPSEKILMALHLSFKSLRRSVAMTNKRLIVFVIATVTKNARMLRTQSVLLLLSMTFIN